MSYNQAWYDYDHLGRTTVKQFPAANVLQEYNMRGCLNHIQAANFNNDPGAGDPDPHIFEEKLFYDKGFKSKLYNGNIAGITWRKAGAEAPEEAYGYSYDNLNRLNHAEYRRLDGSVWKNTVYDYTASNISYDLNGNLQSMDQEGVMAGSTNPIPMDRLTYNYAPFSNKLIKVTDGIAAVNTTTLPDFKDGANVATEYTYDANGNMITDQNKKITGITYNYLNKPEVITVEGGTITYVYDAAGNRLRKTVYDNVAHTTEIYDYIGKSYKNNLLQYILNEEGRTRPVVHNGETKYVYDYFIKDHLGNVRSTVTADPVTAEYLAGHELASANIEQLVFENIPNVRDGRPGSTSPDDAMAAKLDGGIATKRVGTALLLKVMPGDRFDISVNAYYDGGTVPEDHAGAADIVASLSSALLGGQNYDGIPLDELPDNVKTIQGIFDKPELLTALDNLYKDDDLSRPRAHLNWLFFNDKMEITGTSGSTQVPLAATGWFTIDPGMVTGGLGTPSNQVIATLPGYVIVYIDNQTIGKEVWFDNLMVGHYTSAVVEENHYYPFGLTLQTDANVNVTGNPYKYQGIELEKHFGLEMYETQFRGLGLDPQLGRFTQIDPKAEKHYEFNPYVSMGDNPVLFKDPDGDDWWATTKFAIAHPSIATDVGSASPGATNISTNATRFSTRGASILSEDPVLKMSNAKEGDEVNAFRHVLWQATITSKYGTDIADEIGRAHEENPSAIDGISAGLFPIISFRNLAAADESIDLANNVTGRQIGEANSGASMKDLAVKVLENFKENGFWTAQKQSDGTFRMVNTRITSEQFKTLQNAFQNLDNNGQTKKEREDANKAAMAAARR